MANEGWEELISKCKDLVGHDVEISESGHFWRGPLKEVRIENDDYVVIELAWSAEQGWDGQWTIITGGPFGINRFGGATEWASWREHDGIVELTVPMVGTARILTEDAGHLSVTVIGAKEPIEH